VTARKQFGWLYWLLGVAVHGPTWHDADRGRRFAARTSGWELAGAASRPTVARRAAQSATPLSAERFLADQRLRKRIMPHSSAAD